MNSYDRNGNLIASTGADGNVMRYSYDANGNCICMENSAGEKMSIAYDALNRRETCYAYTPNGNLSSVTDALGNETRYAYDSMERLVKVERIGDGGGQRALRLPHVMRSETER